MQLVFAGGNKAKTMNKVLMCIASFMWLAETLVGYNEDRSIRYLHVRSFLHTKQSLIAIGATVHSMAAASNGQYCK